MSKGTGAAKLVCKRKQCMERVSKFGFCVQHFDEFKLGLITKHGELVPDYNKKLEYYGKLKKGA